mgnify:FL=1
MEQTILQKDGNKNIINEDGLKSTSDKIYNILTISGMIIAVIVGTILGIKFMVSSIEEKAKIKEILIVYIIGCVVLVGAFSLWKIIVNLMS